MTAKANTMIVTQSLVGGDKGEGVFPPSPKPSPTRLSLSAVRLVGEPFGHELRVE
jgi:hypothetical protein